MSDEGENELAFGREKIKQYHEHIQKLRIEMEEKVDDEVLVSTKKRRYKNIKDDDGPSNKQLADNELHSDYISSSDPGSYKSTSEASDVDDAQRKRSSGLHYKPNGTFEDFFLEQIFNDSKQFKLALSEFSLKNQFAYTFKKNDSVRVRAKCSATGCKWEILASIHGNDNSFRLKDDITKMPWMKARNIRALVRKQMGLTIDLPKARRAKLIVMKEIQQSYIDEFKRLREYADELLSTNIGSTVKLEVDRSTPDEPAIFHRMYICFGAIKENFMHGCRPIIGLDGCFLKGLVKGQLLVAVGRDGNNQMFPIAWSIIQGRENTDNWKWFLNLLKADLGIIDGMEWTIMSDMQKVRTLICNC
nr:Transposase, MuDR, plant [Ipomoea batatas]